MRVVSFKRSPLDALKCGIQSHEGVADVAEVAQLAGVNPPDGGAWSTRTLIALPADTLGRLDHIVLDRSRELARAGALFAIDDVILGPPVPDPPKIVCLGLNYRDHAAEAGLAAPAAPMFFAKWANSLVGPAEAIVPPPTTSQVDYEAELAVVIGRRGRHIPAAEALDHVFGAMAFNDVSARDLQLANNLWTGGKAVDTFGPCGPALVSLDELSDLQALALRTRVNGRMVQDGTTADMIFSVAETIAFLSRVMTLEPGDIIATGTPAGVGNSRDPKLFLQPGDIVEVEVDGIGVLRNPVADPA